MLPLTIALDGTPLTVPTGGIARYTAALSRALAERYPDVKVVLTSDQPFPVPPGPPNLIADQGPRHGLDRRWWAYGLPRWLTHNQVSLFHGTDFSVPYLHRKPAVMTIHDLSPWRFAQWQPGAQRIRRRTRLLLRLQRADMVLTPSEAIRREVMDAFNLRPDRVAATPLAADERFQPVAPWGHLRPYFLFVGTIEPRKNIPMLIDAWRPLSGEADLLIAGRQRQDGPTLPALPGLHLLGPVPDEHLPSLYSGALAVAYPSHYEGFGLPALEAMRCGAPVLVSTDAAIGEVVGTAGERLDPHDGHAWSSALRAALQPDWRAQRKESSLRQALQFSWSRTSEQTFAAYQEAMTRFGR